MNKSELIDAIAAKAGITKAQAGDALNTTIEAISGALSKKDSVALVGFGTFSTTHKPARVGRNPSTGKELNIEAKTVAKFKPGKGLSDAVNN